MSLLAATLIASTAFAAENATTDAGYNGPSNIKVSGDAKLFYSTNDSMDPGYNPDPDAALFRQENSAGQAALGLGVTADLTNNISAGTHLTALSSLGLANNLVANVWEGTPEDEFWFDQVWLAGTWGKTTAKIGRMELDTPLVFSEKWSIVANTFEAAVLINQDIPDTTLVGAYVGQSNGGGVSAAVTGANASGYAGVTADFAGGSANTNFHSFYKGAYAAGAINNSWEPLTVQAWYYQAQSLLNTYWIQADLNIIGLDFGAQFVGLNETGGTINGTTLSNESATAFAGKIGYAMENTFTVSGAFSQTSKDATTLNVGANLDSYGQTKLYTEAWWNYGYVTLADTTAINVTATIPEELTYVALGAYITQATTKDGIVKNSGEVVDATMMEVTLEAAKSFGPLDVGVYYILTDSNADNVTAGDDNDEGQASNTVQAYLTYNF